MNSADLEAVIDGGYCVGCGACAAFDAGIGMLLDDVGRMQAVLPQARQPTELAGAVCPFTGVGPDEDALARDLFSEPGIIRDGRIGRHLACFGGWVEEGDFRARASSGGIGTWLQSELLAGGHVDAVINVAPSGGGASEPLFSFSVVRTLEEISANSKTRYYPVEMSVVIRHMIDNPGRYAAIGTPCFAKALRLSALQSPVLAERLTYVIGIVCGHLKSAAFASSISEQCGIDPDTIQSIDFRAKLDGRPASRYGVTVTGARLDGSGMDTVTRPMEGLVGANWGHGLFKYKACEFCDDVLAETADAVVGDAWLPAYDSDPRGANVLIVRRQSLLTLLSQARAEGRLHLDHLVADDVAASQAGGLRHRREGLAYRLWLTDREGRWRPRKRVAAARRHLAPAMRRVHEARYALGQLSHEAWRAARAAGDPVLFKRLIAPKIVAYDRQMTPGPFARTLGFIERRLDAALFRLKIRR